MGANAGSYVAWESLGLPIYAAVGLTASAIGMWLL
jgi:hypothetical protein